MPDQLPHFPGGDRERDDETLARPMRVRRSSLSTSLTYERMIDRCNWAGIAVPDQDVLELARLLREAGFNESAERIKNAYDLETKILALTIPEREQIIRALDEPPDGLAELRTVLLREHEGRVREGLV